MRNANPTRMSPIRIIISGLAIFAGAYLIWSDFDTLLRFLKLFAGFFLLMFGLGLLSVSVRRF